MSTSKATKEVNTVATELDFDKMDLAALRKHLDTATEKFNARKSTELKTLVNGWVAKAESIGYTIDDVLAEVKGRKEKKPKGTAVKKEKGPVTHRDPKNPENVYRGKGPSPKWMAAAIKAGAKKEDFAV